MASKTDYKISHRSNRKNSITVIFYEGDVTTEDEYDSDTGTTKPVTRYRRTAILKTIEIPCDFSFSKIKSIRKFNKELAKDGARNPIPEQSDVG